MNQQVNSLQETGSLTDQDRQKVRRRVLKSLVEQGFAYRDGRIVLSEAEETDKAYLRRLNRLAVQHRIDSSEKALSPMENQFLSVVARGKDLDPNRIAPELRLVKPDSFDSRLFRWIALHWSIPVSAGYGRRLRFLVWDKYHDKVVGILGLTDPVYALGPRDTWIGWTPEERSNRLRHVMDAYVLGAISPYRELLFGKFVGLSAVSDEVRQMFHRRYAGSVSVIKETSFSGELALVTTTSALGRSSIYNRLKFNTRLAFEPVGYTQGSGEFQFLNGLYDELKEVASMVRSPTAKHAKWGKGFRNRREVVRTALQAIGLSVDLNYHGIRREIYCAPLAKNTKAFLKGDHEELEAHVNALGELYEYFKYRWLQRRAATDKRYLPFDPESLRIWR